MGQGLRRSLALAKYLFILSRTTRKNFPFVDSFTKYLSPSTKYQFPYFNPIKTSFLAFQPLSLLLNHSYFNFIFFVTQVMLTLISINVQCLQNVVFSFEKRFEQLRSLPIRFPQSNKKIIFYQNFQFPHLGEFPPIPEPYLVKT